MTPSKFLIRGLLAGLIAGLAAFAVAYTVGEPQVNDAIALEEAGTSADAAHHDHAADAAPEKDHVTKISRPVQSTWGLLTGTLAIGVAMGGVTALAAAFALGRIGSLKPTQTTALVALLGFVAVGLVPFLKYPATPPAAGSAETIGDRTSLYFGFLALSVVMVIVETIFAASLLRRGTSVFVATVAPAFGFLVIIGLAAASFPTVNEVGDFPAADTLWFFRRASILTTAALWATIGVILTGLIGRLYARESAAQARRELAASL
jgi:hypothetical protein